MDQRNLIISNVARFKMIDPHFNYILTGDLGSNNIKVDVITQDLNDVKMICLN
jgi:hypothetical protein